MGNNESESEYANGYIERRRNGAYKGTLTIERVNLSPIVGVYFAKDGKEMLWLKRAPMVEYDDVEDRFYKREKNPMWEAYLIKQDNANGIAYRGEFVFMRFRFSIIGVWDGLYSDKNRLNLYVERLPMSRQNIIKKISETNQKHSV